MSVCFMCVQTSVSVRVRETEVPAVFLSLSVQLLADELHCLCPHRG